MLQYYCNNYAAVPSCSKLAESALKDANHVQIKGHGEMLSSTISTARSGLVNAINCEAVKSFQQKEFVYE